MRTIRRDATQPAQRRLRSSRDLRAALPSVFPSGTSPDGKGEVIFKPGSKENTRPQAGPRGLWTPSESTLTTCPKNRDHLTILSSSVAAPL